MIGIYSVSWHAATFKRVVISINSLLPTHSQAACSGSLNTHALCETSRLGVRHDISCALFGSITATFLFHSFTVFSKLNDCNDFNRLCRLICGDLRLGQWVMASLTSQGDPK